MRVSLPEKFMPINAQWRACRRIASDGNPERRGFSSFRHYGALRMQSALVIAIQPCLESQRTTPGSYHRVFFDLNAIVAFSREYAREYVHAIDESKTAIRSQRSAP